MNSQLDNKPFDMATATKIVTVFTGKEDEDICTWIRDLLLVAEVNEWTEDNIFRVTILCLQGKARSWAAQILKGKMSGLTLDALFDLLKRRFALSTTGEISITTFCNLGIAATREDFSFMLRQATRICERNII